MKALLAAALAVLLLSGCASTTDTTAATTTEVKNTTPESTELVQEIPEVTAKTAAELLAEAQSELDGGYAQLAKKKLNALIADYPDAPEVAEANKMIAAIDKQAEKEDAEQAEIAKEITSTFGESTEIDVDFDAKMTADAFAQLSEGMSMYDVVKIVGGPGTLSSSGQGTAIYSYEGVGQVGANALITYQDGKLVSKAQAGLE